jgi:ferredoxin
MALVKQRLPANVAGDFYVDASCIDCGTCRWVAPDSFADAGTSSFVRSQPRDSAERLRALMALAACPTGSIGTVADDDLAPALAAFPERIAGEVYHCGYHAKASFGAASYLSAGRAATFSSIRRASPRRSSAASRNWAASH